MAATVDLAPLSKIVARLEAVADRFEGATPGAAKASGGGGAAADCALAVAFDAFVEAKVKPIKAAADELGVPDVSEGTDMVMKVFALMRALLAATGACKKPQDSQWAVVLKPVVEIMQQAGKACDNRSDFFQHRKACAEALNFSTMLTAASPPSHVQNVLESMDFHAIKVMQRKVPAETAWAKALKEAIVQLKEWCNENCKLGPTWKADGPDAAEYFGAHPLGSDAPKPGGKGKGKGPPVPAGGIKVPVSDMPAPPKASGGGGGGMSAVFADIAAKGTGGLKKVTDDMKTKNRPKDDVAGPIPSKAPAKAAEPAAPVAAAKKPPSTRQDDKKWFLEYHEGVQMLEMNDVDRTHLVNIFKCKNTTVKINGKVNGISIDSCEKVNVVMTDVISTVELVNCQRCKVQTMGKVHSFAIDKSDGVNIILSNESMGAEITTSKSSEMNLTYPQGEGEDWIELPIPEQFVTKIAASKKLETTVSGIYSG